jgi:hypothetical protein
VEEGAGRAGVRGLKKERLFLLSQNVPDGQDFAASQILGSGLESFG